MTNDIKLKSKNAKYPNHKWIESDDGILVFVCATKTDITLTVWDTEKRLIKVEHRKGHEISISRGF